MTKILPGFLAFAVLTAALLSGASPASAHHSYAMFNMDKTVSVQGTVKEFAWSNPHIYVWLYAKNADGKQELWAVEGGSPNALSRIGWSRHTLTPGDKVTMELHPLRDGRTGGFISKLILADGTVMTLTGEGERRPNNAQAGTPRTD